MTRPFVQVVGTNLVEPLRQHLAAQLPIFKAIPGLVGITLNGGLSRGYADHLSEIDVTLFLNAATYREWQTQRSPVALGITVIDGQVYDIKAVDIDQEWVRVWESDALWDASYAEILYDSEGAVQRLYAEKLASRPSAESAGGFMMSCWWYYRLAGDIWIERGDVVQGHAMLNQAAVNLVKAIFCANQEFIPHEKWLFHMSRSLAWQPDNWPVRMAETLSTGDLSIQSMIERQRIIDSLWREVDVFLIAHYFADLPVHVMQRSTYQGLILLAQRRAIPLAEWQALGFGASFNYEPLHAVVRIENDTIMLDKEKLIRLSPDTFYAWHGAVAEATQQSIRLSGGE